MATFGTFAFLESEGPLLNTYTDWQVAPAYDQAQLLGAARTDVTLLSVPSARLSFVTRLTRARFQEAQALVGSVATLVEAETRTALLLSVTPVGFVYAAEGRFLKVRWEFIEQ